MVDKQILREVNTHWHNEYLGWMQEAKQWQHETQRLLALLYLLERALPEHSSRLNKHAAFIADNEQQLSNYECEIDNPTCGTSQGHHAEIQQRLSKLHQKAKQEHLELKHAYSKEMDSFKLLVLKLLKEC